MFDDDETPDVAGAPIAAGVAMLSGVVLDARTLRGAFKALSRLRRTVASPMADPAASEDLERMLEEAAG